MTAPRKIPFIDYCKDVGIEMEDVFHTYANILKMMHKFIKNKGIKENEDIRINGRMLIEGVVDYYIDIQRIKAHHPINNPSEEKDTAYKAYWLLRRKPFQVIKPFPNCEFVNEYFITLYFLSIIAYESRISDEEKRNNPKWLQFRSLLYHNLKYRHVSQQAFELMLMAFFCGHSFTN